MNQARRSSSGFQVAPFLQACGLCKKELQQDTDIYVYKGEVAFCSVECRQEYIDERERRKKAGGPSTQPGRSSS